MMVAKNMCLPSFDVTNNALSSYATTWASQAEVSLTDRHKYEIFFNLLLNIAESVSFPHTTSSSTKTPEAGQVLATEPSESRHHSKSEQQSPTLGPVIWKSKSDWQQGIIKTKLFVNISINEFLFDGFWCYKVLVGVCHDHMLCWFFPSISWLPTFLLFLLASCSRTDWPELVLVMIVRSIWHECEG